VSQNLLVDPVYTDETIGSYCERVRHNFHVRQTERVIRSSSIYRGVPSLTRYGVVLSRPRATMSFLAGASQLRFRAEI